MDIVYLRQLAWENESWMRAYIYMQQEVSNLKMRLAEVVSGVKLEELHKLEDFQNRFIKKDTVLTILHHDIDAQKKRLNAALANNSPDEQITKNQARIRIESENIEKRVAVLKTAFYTYLDQNFAALN